MNRLDGSCPRHTVRFFGRGVGDGGIGVMDGCTVGKIAVGVVIEVVEQPVVIKTPAVNTRVVIIKFFFICIFIMIASLIP
jgi:hypothetical protein